ncbi:MAG: 50S ribosomal protein L6 [Mycoplasmataceae bacterium]|jgi:large subunit ribosomal protein L6|nr:50S ribosomal protein L6 [Mycoplasmataceae bacterium]
MSRKGNKLITIPQNATVTINADHVIIKNGANQLRVNYPNKIIKVENINNALKVSRLEETKAGRTFHGTVASSIMNALHGVTTGFHKSLKIVGVGYKAAISNKQLKLDIGFSHPVIFDIPAALHVICPVPTQIDINGFDKQLVGEFAANVRATRKPEPYNGKGIMYSDEIIIRKVGKTAEGAGATASAAPAKK